jgi:hypothetical protein
MHAHGDFPNVLYRAFDKLEFAQQFLQGKLRFGNVTSYRRIEGARQDKTEGTGYYTFDEVSKKSQFCSNSIYALCCHRTLEAATSTGHGKYIVEITNPFYLAEKATESLCKLKSKHFGGIEGVFIEYDKGEEKLEALDLFESSRLTYSQKPESYSHEEEFRYVFIRKDFAGNNLCIFLENGIGGGVIFDYT